MKKPIIMANTRTQHKGMEGTKREFYQLCANSRQAIQEWILTHGLHPRSVGGVD